MAKFVSGIDNSYNLHWQLALTLIQHFAQLNPQITLQTTSTSKIMSSPAPEAQIRQQKIVLRRIFSDLQKGKPVPDRWTDPEGFGRLVEELGPPFTIQKLAVSLSGPQVLNCVC